MKRTIYFAFTFALLFAFSCSSVGEEEMIPDPNPVVVTPTNPDTNTGGDIEGAQDRVVLIEEVTGQKCPNCPGAHSTLKAIVSANSGKIAPVAIQALGLAGTLKIEKGDEIARNVLGATYQPQGAVNRTGTGSHNSWASAVKTELAKDPFINLSIEKSINGSNLLTVKLKGFVKKAIDKASQVTVYLIEDGIIASQQKSGEGEITNYTHDHVLRAVLTDVKGDTWKASGLAKDEELSMTFTHTLSGSWKTDKVQIVAFIHEKDSKYVHQAIIQKIN